MNKRQRRKNEKIEKKINQRVRQNRINSQLNKISISNIENDEDIDDAMFEFSNIFSFEFYRKIQNLKKRRRVNFNQLSIVFRQIIEKSSINYSNVSFLLRENSFFRVNSSLSITISLRQNMFNLITSQLIEKQKKKFAKQKFRKLTTQVEQAKLKTKHMKLINKQMIETLKRTLKSNNF